VVAGHEKSEIALEAIAVDDRGERRRSRLVRLDQNEVALSLGSVELEKIRQVLIYDWLRLQFWQHLLLLFLLLLLVHWLLLGHWLLFLLGDCPLMCHRLPSLVRLLLSFLARLKLQPVKVTLLSFRSSTSSCVPSGCSGWTVGPRVGAAIRNVLSSVVGNFSWKVFLCVLNDWW